MDDSTRDYDPREDEAAQIMKQGRGIKVVRRCGGHAPIGTEPEAITPEEFRKKREQKLQEVARRIQSELQGKE